MMTNLLVCLLLPGLLGLVLSGCMAPGVDDGDIHQEPSVVDSGMPTHDAAAADDDAAAAAEAAAEAAVDAIDVATDAADAAFGHANDGAEEENGNAVHPQVPVDGSPVGQRRAIDVALSSLESANIAFNSPSAMRLGQAAQIELLLSMERSVADLQAEIAADGELHGAAVRVSHRMEARLTGSNFSIIAIMPEEQIVGSTDTVQWKWEVEPKSEGRHTLHLTLTAIVALEGSTARKAIRTFDRRIEVQVGMGQRVRGFVAGHWQWLWAAVLVPLAGFAWRARNRTRDGNQGKGSGRS